MHRFVQFIKNDLMFLFNLKRVTYPSNNKRPFHPHFANVSNDNDISKMLICHCLLKHLKKEPCYDVPPSSSKYFEVQFWHKKKLSTNMASNETWKFVVFVHSLLQTNNHVEKKRKRTNFCHRKWAANLILAFSTPSIVYY